MIRRIWTDGEIGRLRELFSRTDIFVHDIAALLDRPISSVWNKAHTLGLSRPPEMLSIAGRRTASSEASVATRFRKGHVPANKGREMSPELRAKVAPTMFRKGNVPRNHRDVGSESTRADGYVWVKVAEPNRWRQKQRLIWERLHGPIPPGHNVQFRNRNRRDFRPENLYLISRADQMRTENSLIASYPKPLVDVIRLKGALKRQIHKREKNEQHEP